MDIFNNNVLIALNLSLDGVFIENLNGDILMCNQAGADMFGYTIEEITQLNIKDFVPPEESYYLKERYTDTDLFPTEYISRVNIKKDGTLIRTEVNSKIIISGGVEYIVAFIRNISESAGVDPKVAQNHISTACWKLIQEEEKQILIRLDDSVGKEKYTVPLVAVEYIESNLKKLKLHLTNGSSLEGYGKLKQLEEQIPPKGRFLRCFQSFIVNMEYAELDENNYLFVMRSGIKVPIRKRQYRQIRQRYYNFKILTQ